jgi:hypothetical protein
MAELGHDAANRTMSGWRTFSFVVYVLFGALAAISALGGVALLIGGLWAAGVIALVFAVVLTVMSISIKRGLQESR